MLLTLCGHMSCASGSIFAPVDGMGCEQGGRNPKQEGEEEPVESEKVCSRAGRIHLRFWRPITLTRFGGPQDKRLSIIVSLMLSSQTKDPVTHQVRPALFNIAREGTFPLADAILTPFLRTGDDEPAQSTTWRSYTRSARSGDGRTDRRVHLQSRLP